MAPLNDARRAVPSAAAPVAVALGLAAFLATQYAGALAVPFINDDYIFLDKTRTAGFLQLWTFEGLAFHWYRPWSRELHYWTLQRLFGARELPFHLASFVLWLAVLMSFWALARRLGGGKVAAVAVAGMAALAAWGVPLLWVAGVQELWMLLFALLTLHAWLAGRRGFATALLLAALLSKETAVMTGPIAVVCSWMVLARRPAAALREAWPLAAVTALWALVHPVLGGRLWRPFSDPIEPGAGSPGLGTLARAALVPFNLDLLPAPERGWGPALVPGLIGALALGAIALSGRAAPEPPAGLAPGRRLPAFGIAWALLGWTPLLLPSLGWHAYYALLGAFGAWFGLAALLEPGARGARLAWVAPVVVMALALLRPARADTPTLDWGSEWYQRRSAEFIRVMRAQLLDAHPRLPPHARLYFVRVPSNVGFLSGDGPALRVWYRDPTVRGAFYSAYRPRESGSPEGPDLFFRFDSTGGWVEVVRGDEDVARARRANPRWEKDHVTLAATLAGAGDWARAAGEYAKLADAEPERVEYAYNAGVSCEALGDSAAAAAWYARAARLPGADDEVRRDAARLAHITTRAPDLRAPR